MFVCVLWFLGCCCNAKSEENWYNLRWICHLQKKNEFNGCSQERNGAQKKKRAEVHHKHRQKWECDKKRQTNRSQRQKTDSESFTAVEDPSAFAFRFLHLADLINLCWNWQKFISLLTHEEAVPIRFSSYAHPLCFQVLSIDSGCDSERWWNVSCEMTNSAGRAIITWSCLHLWRLHVVSTYST